ncbi:MAG: hypothetical protein R6X02_15875 [Enhygromyxa sp.]
MTAAPSEPEPSAAARVIDALVAGGQPVDEGRFSLDVAAAADKLDSYQHADRSAYLVPLVEGARGLDTRRITLTTHGEDLSISRRSRARTLRWAQCRHTRPSTAI